MLKGSEHDERNQRYITWHPPANKRSRGRAGTCRFSIALKRNGAALKPFKGLKITLSVHLEAKTASLCRVLQALGAEMHATGCNPLSTQDDVAAALCAGNGRDAGMDVNAWHAATPAEYERHLTSALSAGPNIIIDDGGDLVNSAPHEADAPHPRYPWRLRGDLDRRNETPGDGPGGRLEIPDDHGEQRPDKVPVR